MRSSLLITSLGFWHTVRIHFIYIYGLNLLWKETAFVGCLLNIRRKRSAIWEVGPVITLHAPKVFLGVPEPGSSYSMVKWFMEVCWQLASLKIHNAMLRRSWQRGCHEEICLSLFRSVFSTLLDKLHTLEKNKTPEIQTWMETLDRELVGPRIPVSPLGFFLLLGVLSLYFLLLPSYWLPELFWCPLKMLWFLLEELKLAEILQTLLNTSRKTQSSIKKHSNTLISGEQVPDPISADALRNHLLRLWLSCLPLIPKELQRPMCTSTAKRKLAILLVKFKPNPNSRASSSDSGPQKDPFLWDLPH